MCAYRARMKTVLCIAQNIMQTCQCNVHPLTPHFLYSKTGVYRGIHYFLIFALNYRLWVLVEAVLTCTHNICIEQKYEKSQKISPENCHFCSREKSLYVAWACFCNGFFLKMNLL